VRFAEVAQLEVAFDQTGGVLGQIDPAGIADLLDARGQADDVALRRVFHAQIIADRADDHLTGVQSDTHQEGQPVLEPQPIGFGSELLLQPQGGVAGALRVVLVRDRGAEECHDAVAGELADEAFEAFDAVGEDAEEALHDVRERFRIKLCGQLHRALHVGEEYRDLFALAFERRA